MANLLAATWFSIICVVLLGIGLHDSSSSAAAMSHPPPAPTMEKIIVLKILLVCVVPFSLCSLGEFIYFSDLPSVRLLTIGPDGHHTLAISFATICGHHGTVVTPALQEN